MSAYHQPLAWYLENRDSRSLRLLAKSPGDLVRVLRADRRWSQGELAEKTGCTRNTIARIESGGQPSPGTIKRLSKVFGVDSELLLPWNSKTYVAEKSDG